MIALASSLCAAPPAAAAPVPDRGTAPCAATAPARGTHFSGPVLQVIDGKRLCVAIGPTPDQWIEVLPVGLVMAAEVSPALGRSWLTTAAFSKRLDCVAGPVVKGAVQAVCTIDGAKLADEVRDAAAAPQWRLWR